MSAGSRQQGGGYAPAGPQSGGSADAWRRKSGAGLFDSFSARSTHARTRKRNGRATGQAGLSGSPARGCCASGGAHARPALSVELSRSVRLSLSLCSPTPTPSRSRCRPLSRQESGGAYTAPAALGGSVGASGGPPLRAARRPLLGVYVLDRLPRASGCRPQLALHSGDGPVCDPEGRGGSAPPSDRGARGPLTALSPPPPFDVVRRRPSGCSVRLSWRGACAAPH